MPTKKHKRKSSAHSKPKVVKPAGLITSHPKAFTLIGLLLVVVSMYLLTFESQDNAMFGLAMITLVSGMVLTISTQLTATKKERN